MSRIPGSNFWSFLFFLMLITLALGSIFGAFETVMTALSDQWPVLRDHTPVLVMVTSSLMLLLGKDNSIGLSSSNFKQPILNI